MINLDVRQSRHANDSASIAMRAEESDFAIANASASTARGHIGT